MQLPSSAQNDSTMESNVSNYVSEKKESYKDIFWEN